MITPKEAHELDPAAVRLLDLLRRGEHAAVLHEFEQLAKSQDLTPGILGVAAHNYVVYGMLDDARRAAVHAVQLSPRSAWLHHALAAAEAGANRWPAALAAQKEAVRLAPDEPNYHAALSSHLRQAGQPAQAVEAARQALLLAPTHIGALNQLGLALAANGDQEGALREFRGAQSAAPSEPEGYMNEGVLHLQAGRLLEARRSFRAALLSRPGLVEAEDGMADTIARGPARFLLGLSLVLARMGILGWLAAIFFYYLWYRLLQFIWRLVPATEAAGEVLLIATPVVFVLVALVGALLRLGFRKGWF